MSKINRIPKGLQSLFGNTAQGSNPDELAEQVRAIIDLSHLWGLEQSEFVRFAGTFAAAFQLQTITVPEGQLWLLKSLSVECAMNVGEVVSATYGVRSAAGFDHAFGMTRNRTAAAAVEVQARGHTFSPYYPVQSGDMLFARANVFTAAAARTMSLRSEIIRLQI